MIPKTSKRIASLSSATDLKLPPHPARKRSSAEVIEELRAHQEELWFQAQQLLDAQTELATSHERLRQFYDRAPVGYMTLDRNGVIEDMNQTASRWLGDPHSRRLRPFLVYVSPSDRQAFLDHMRRCREGLMPHVFSRLSLRSPTGQDIPVELSSKRSPETSGVGARFPTVIVNVSDLVEAREAARELQEQLNRSERLAAVGVLAAGIAHEINNPMNAIRMMAEFALQCPDEVDVKDTFREVIAQADRCTEIVRGILRFARNEPTQKSIVDVNNLIRRAAALARAHDADRLTLTLDLSTAESLVQVNTIEIEQVILNLVRNAVQAKEGDGCEVTIRSEPASGSVRIHVMDNGPGIPEPDLPKIFDPFYSTHQGRGGTGLGLTICHRIVQEHGGSLSARSKSGQGATFIIELPTVDSV